MKNIIVDFWGSSAWRLIHSIAFAYSENPSPNEMNKVKAFYENLRYVLPCEKCRHHYNILLDRIPLTNTIMSNREKLIYWTYRIHCEVNKSRGMKGSSPSFTEFYRFYSNAISS